MWPNLKTDLAGLRLRNPTVLASGVLGISASTFKRAEDAGAGAVTTKTVTEKPKEGYPNPTFVELEFGYVNAMGLPNPGAEAFSEEIREAKKILSIPVICSVGGSDGREFSLVAEEMLNAGADALELNLSCPHTKGLGLEIGSDRGLVREIVRDVKSVSERPVFVKVSAMAFGSDLIETVIEAGADGIAAINTLRAVVIDWRAMAPVLSNVFGGLSGKCIRPVALAVVYQIHKEHPDLPVIGIGGVDGWESALEFLMAGARAVGVGSAIIEKDLSIFWEIIRGLSSYLETRGLGSISEIVGMAHRR